LGLLGAPAIGPKLGSLGARALDWLRSAPPDGPLPTPDPSSIRTEPHEAEPIAAGLGSVGARARELASVGAIARAGDWVRFVGDRARLGSVGAAANGPAIGFGRRRGRHRWGEMIVRVVKEPSLIVAIPGPSVLGNREACLPNLRR
jgi:hypothetical protein